MIAPFPAKVWRGFGLRRIPLSSLPGLVARFNQFERI
jgi:hypothetical protein